MARAVAYLLPLLLPLGTQTFCFGAMGRRDMRSSQGCQKFREKKTLSLLLVTGRLANGAVDASFLTWLKQPGLPQQGGPH